MKMKYYVRGLGIGFVISSLIFIMAFSFYKPGYSKDEIKKMAEKEGFTVSESSSTLKESNADKKTKKTTDKTTTKAKDKTKSDSTTDLANSTQKAADEKNSTTATKNSDGSTTTKTEVAPENVVKNNIRIEVSVGATDSLAIANDIASMGVVDNGKSFDDYMNENGYSKRIQPGTFEFHKGMTYDEVANILVNKN
ncbi:MAG: hypothetical protein KBA87_03165 [Lachnospiraceae bacterium]|nr:hypothetical protein [Lachnospiraceae bacterium]